jgi:DNA-binding transcriptional ArsR family regulator
METKQPVAAGSGCLDHCVYHPRSSSVCPTKKLNSMFKALDPMLHSQVRLAIMSLLISVKTAEFSFLLENINTTKGNLSFQLTKLKDSGYIDSRKSFRGNYPLTTCEITEKGIQAYEHYVNDIDEYFIEFKNNKNQ